MVELDLGKVVMDSYADLKNKPKINDVELDGNKTIDDLGGLTAESTVSFSQAAERTNIEATDNVKGIFGKVKKWFADLKPHAFSNPTNNLLATEPGTALDAVQGKALNDMITAVNLARLSGKQYSTLVNLVEATATDISVPHYFRFKDLGGFVLGKANAWYRILVYYQNPYNDSTTYSVGGTGILWDAENVYRVFIGGTKATGVSLTLEKLITETELNNGLTSINVYHNTDFQTVADSVPINKKLTCRMLGSGNSAVTGLPASQLFIVEIYAISEATAIATAYASESGNMYVNRRATGIWQGWAKKTDTIS